MRRLRAWVYPKESINAPPNCRRGEMSLDADWVSRPEDADILHVPFDAGILAHSGFDFGSLRYWKERERDHLLMHTSDYERALGVRAIVIRVSTTHDVLATDRRTIGWCGTAYDHGDLAPVPEGGFRFDVTLRAFRNSLREQAVNSCLRAGLKVDHSLNPEFHGYIYNTELGKKRVIEFKEGLRASRVVLAPRSGAASSYRFFEAMSAGRCVVWLSEHYVPPQRPGLNWDRFAWSLPEHEVAGLGQFVKEFVLSLGDAELVARGLEARAAWERWFHIERWPPLMSEQIVTMLAREGKVLA